MNFDSYGINNMKDNIKGSFVHFNSLDIMTQFKMDNTGKYLYGHECCGGKGILILNITQKEAIEIEKELSKMNKNRIQQMRNKKYKNNNSKLSSFECSVCYETYNLNNSAKINCDHLFCNSCIDQIKTKTNLDNNCPLCRRTLF
tara:strand:- start:491 stop:922 length:432 start_codon:yes stop_codon:yes gene_type:complete